MAVQAILAVLLISSILAFEAARDININSTGFRVFRGSELSILEGLSPRERLDVAAKAYTSHIVNLTSASQAAVAQEKANINLDCLPRLSEVPGESIKWKFILLDEFGASEPKEIAPSNPDDPDLPRIVVGGQFNRWLNISRVNIVGSAEFPDSGIYICEVCQARGTPSEQCNTTNFTLNLIGEPPVIIKGNSNQPCLPGLVTPGDNGGILEAVMLPCMVSDTVPRPVPLPDVTWFRNNVLVGTGESGTHLEPDSGFRMQFPILNLGVFDQQPFVFLGQDMVFSTSIITNITSPMMGGLPADTTTAQARAELFNILLGNWVCVANNTLGMDSVEYNIRMCEPQSSIPVPEVEGLCSIVIWESGLSDSAVSCEDILGYNVRLYHPESKHQNLTVNVEMDKTYYKISDEDKDVKIDHETLVQVQVVHRDNTGDWSKAVPLGCEGSTETPSMYFELNNMVYLNNSVIRLRDIGEGERALLCKTDREDCCGTPPNRYGEFYYPNGVSVPIARQQQGFYRNRGEQMIRLNRRSTATSPTGKYRCDIPGVDGEIQSIYVTLTA